MIGRDRRARWSSYWRDGYIQILLPLRQDHEEYGRKSQSRGDDAYDDVSTSRSAGDTGIFGTSPSPASVSTQADNY
jgi:hypothetical protein